MDVKKKAGGNEGSLNQISSGNTPSKDDLPNGARRKSMPQARRG